MTVTNDLFTLGATVLTDVFAVRITGDKKDKWLDHFTEKLSRMNGGASVSHTLGTWPDENSLGIEASTLIEVNCESAEYVFRHMANDINAWLVDCEQEAAWIRLNNIVLIIPAFSMRLYIAANDEEEEKFLGDYIQEILTPD